MPKLKNSSAGHLEINLGINFQDQLKKVWNVDFWGQNSLHNVYNFWANNVWFRRVPVIRFGWNFKWMHKIWFRKIYIPASRLYDLIENPRSLEAASGQTEPRSFRPPYMVLKWLPLVSGSQKWPRPRAASSDLGISKRSHSLEAGNFFFRNQILFIVLKYEPNRTTGTLPNRIFFVQKLSSWWRPKWRSKCKVSKIFQLILKIHV